MLSLRPAISRQVRIYFFLLCGGYAADLLCYLLLLDAGINSYAAYLLGFCVGTVCNVLLLRRYFAPGRHELLKDFMLTFAGNGATILGGLALYAALMRLGAITPVFAKVGSNAATFAVNYVVRRRFF